VQLFGHLRDFERCAPTLNSFIFNKYNCDVFIHTWNKTDHNTKSWHNRKVYAREVSGDLIEIVKTLYRPKKVIFEEQKSYKFTQLPYLYNPILTFSTATLYYMFYSMNTVNKLRVEYANNNKIEYDLVLVLRPDIQLKSDLELEEIISQAKLLNLPLDKCRFFASRKENSNSACKLYINQPNDLLFFGLPSVIDRYISCNLSIDDDYAKAHSINVVSIYTSREIKNGIIPIPMAYNLGEDWTFMGYRNKSDLSLKNWNNCKKIIGYLAIVLFDPIRKIYQFAEKRYSWLTDKK